MSLKSSSCCRSWCSSAAGDDQIPLVLHFPNSCRSITKILCKNKKNSHQEFIAGFWQQEINHQSWSCCAQWSCCGIQLLLKSTSSSCVRSLRYSCWCIICNYCLFLPKTWEFHHKWIHEYKKKTPRFSSCNSFVSWSWGLTGFQFNSKSLHLCTDRYIAVLMHINSAAKPCPKCSSTLKLFRLRVLVGLSVSLLLPASGFNLGHPQVTGFGVGHPQATGFDLGHVKVDGSSLGHPWATGSSLRCPWETGSNSGHLLLIKSDLFCQQATKFFFCRHRIWKFSNLYAYRVEDMFSASLSCPHTDETANQR